ncbi:hypothetical protein LCGC14_1723970 [marine sediment metagenome]|uniref:Uncharacterized protein n=1 Tax=marine sediment metagenome TaxID=412755 RepID=A0A0F9HBP4_9ZZZZ
MNIYFKFRKLIAKIHIWAFGWTNQDEFVEAHEGEKHGKK